MPGGSLSWVMGASSACDGGVARGEAHVAAPVALLCPASWEEDAGASALLLQASGELSGPCLCARRSVGLACSPPALGLQQ